jgi:DNA-binding CsgD family transcriptional regulator
MLRGVVIALDDSDEAQDARREPPGPDAGDLMAGRVARLTPAQLDCLLLVDQHLSSKEIAAELHISPHTVDQRIRQALAILGVERRSQAARVVAQAKGPYQRLIHQSPYIPATQRPGSAIRFGTLTAQGRLGKLVS